MDKSELFSFFLFFSPNLTRLVAIFASESNIAFHLLLFS